MEKALAILKHLKWFHNEFKNEDLSEWTIDCDDYNKIEEAIGELEEAIKPKTCDACKFLNGVICKHDRGLYCVRQFEEDYFQPKDNA